MSYEITVTVTATIRKRSGNNVAPVGRVEHTTTRTNGAPSETYAVHDIEAAGDEAIAVVAKMAEAGYGRSTKPDWECS